MVTKQTDGPGLLGIDPGDSIKVLDDEIARKRGELALLDPRSKRARKIKADLVNLTALRSGKRPTAPIKLDLPTEPGSYWYGLRSDQKFHKAASGSLTFHKVTEPIIRDFRGQPVTDEIRGVHVTRRGHEIGLVANLTAYQLDDIAIHLPWKMVHLFNLKDAVNHASGVVVEQDRVRTRFSRYGTGRYAELKMQADETVHLADCVYLFPANERHSVGAVPPSVREMYEAKG